MRCDPEAADLRLELAEAGRVQQCGDTGTTQRILREIQFAESTHPGSSGKGDGTAADPIAAAVRSARLDALREWKRGGAMPRR